MSLRTYPLIAHPAFISFIESRREGIEFNLDVDAGSILTHRPSIEKIEDIANYLQISDLFIKSAIRSPSRHYRTFSFRKKSGGYREINSPRTFLKVLQWWILDTILYNAEISENAHGFVPHRSFITNARKHVGSRHVVNVDIRDFFPSIDKFAVHSIFEHLGYSQKASRILSSLTTFNGALPQGAPTSPALANLILKDFDRVIAGQCEAIGAKYTRYADDITISSLNFIPQSIVDSVAVQLFAHGMFLNDRKTRFMGPNKKKEVTGLILGKSGVRIDAGSLNSARGWFHKIKMSPFENYPHLQRLQGTLALFKSVGGAGSASVIKIGEEATELLWAVRKMAHP